MYEQLPHLPKFSKKENYIKVQQPTQLESNIYHPNDMKSQNMERLK